MPDKDNKPDKKGKGFDGNLKELVEALIFAADHPLSVDKLSAVIESAERDDIKKALEELMADYSEGRGITLAEVGGGFQLRTSPEHAPWIKRFFKVGLQRISKQAMEAMAIVAYKQPVTRGELEEIRGVDSGGVLKTLLDKRLAKIVGKKDVPGRPVVYGTTKEFLEVFDLKGLMDLPTLKDIEILKEDEEENYQEGLFEARRGDMLTDAEIQAEREIEKVLEEQEKNKQNETDEEFDSESEEIDEEDSEEEDGEYSEEGEEPEEPESKEDFDEQDSEEEAELEGRGSDQVGGSGNDGGEEPESKADSNDD